MKILLSVALLLVATIACTSAVDCRSRPCPRIGVRPPCKIVPGDPKADFPKCCPREWCPPKRVDDCKSRPCPRIGVHPPCRFVPGNPKAPFPGCCPRVWCPPKRADDCKSRPCPRIPVHEPCKFVPGDPKAKYPGCCPQVWCPPDMKSVIYTNPTTGRGCMKEFIDKRGFPRGGVGCPSRVVPPPCKLVPGDQTADWPGCCPQKWCPKHCKNKK